jgi:hypothetical protein
MPGTIGWRQRYEIEREKNATLEARLRAVEAKIARPEAPVVAGPKIEAPAVTEALQEGALDAGRTVGRQVPGRLGRGGRGVGSLPV